MTNLSGAKAFRCVLYVEVAYPIKTLNQLPLVLKAYRKVQGLTQTAMAEKLGITQQSYAYFEANPATSTLERLFTVLRLLNVEISFGETTAPSKAKLAMAERLIGVIAQVSQLLPEGFPGDVAECIFAGMNNQSLRLTKQPER